MEKFKPLNKIRIFEYKNIKEIKKKFKIFKKKLKI